MSDEVVLTIGSRELTQEQCALLVFKLFEFKAFDLRNTLHQWRVMIDDEDFSKNDLVFLLIYAFEKLLPPEDREKLELVLTLLRKELEE